MPAGRYSKVVKQIREAGELARSGALSLDDGTAAIYFLWGQPSHAYIRDGEELVEGEAALKRIAHLLATPGKMQWKSKEVLQKETLRTSRDDLIAVLEELGEASTASPDVGSVSTDVWDGTDRRRPEAFSYNIAEFPLLPAAAPLWSDVPTSVVHLDVLLASLPSVLITFDAPSVKAAGVVFQSELHDALWVDADGAVMGREAWERILSRQDGTVSAYELDDRLAEALPILWRSRILFRDLDKRWLDAQRFVDTVSGAGGDRAVIVATHTKVGIALYLRGELAGAWTSTHRASNPLVEDILDMLLERVEGAVTVIERTIDDLAEPYPLDAPKESPQDEPVTTPETRPEWLSWGEEPPGRPPELRSEQPSPLDSPPPPPVAAKGGSQPLFALSEGNASFAESVPAPPAPAASAYDFDGLIRELIAIGEERLGPGFVDLAPLLEGAERSASGLRSAIRELRQTALVGHDQQKISDAGREMLRYVSDRLTGS